MIKNKISELIYENVKGEIPTQFSNLTKKEREDKIRGLILNELGLETYDKKAFRRAVREKEALVFNIIEELCDQVLADGEYAKSAFYNNFVDLRNLSLGDKNEFYVENHNKLEVSELAPGNFALKRRRVDRGQSFSLDMKVWGIKIYEELDRIISGRTDFAYLINLVLEAVDKHLSDLAESTFMSALKVLPTGFTYNGTYDEDAIIKVAQHVQASNNGVKPRIVGTDMAIAKLQGSQDVAVQSESMKNEVNQRGIMKMWKGYECFPIAQGHKIGTFDFTMPEDELFFLVGDSKIVKMVLEGETMIKETKDYENADNTVEYSLVYRANACVAFSNLIGHITLT